MTESSNNVTTVIRGISKFDGTPAKYLDWKRVISATLQLTRPDIYEILDGAPCPQEKYDKIPQVQRTAAENTAAAVPARTPAPTAAVPARTPAPQEAEKEQEDEDQEDDQDQDEDQDRDNQGENLERELRETAQGRSPALDLSMYRLRLGDTARYGQHTDSDSDGLLLVNAKDILKWKKSNAALFSVLHLTTVGAAGSVLTKFEAKKEGEFSDGQAAWRFMRDKYENNSSQRRRILMRKLDNSRMEHGEDPDNFFSRVEYLIDDLAALNEPVTQHRKMDVILNGLTSDYSLVKFQAMKDSELSLEDLMSMMRNLYVNGLTRSGYTSHRGSAMYSDGSGMTIDKSRVKCHRCGKFGHFKNDCHLGAAVAAGRGSNPRKPGKSSAKKTTARTRWCSFCKSTSHNDSDCYKLKELEDNNTMKPRAGRKYRQNNGHAQTAMIQPQHSRNGSDRRAQTESHYARKAVKPSAKGRKHGSDSSAKDAIYTMQSDDEEYDSENPNLYTHGTEYGYTPSDESTGFSFSTETTRKAYEEDALTMRKEDALMMRKDNIRKSWHKNAQTACNTAKHDDSQCKTHVVVPDEIRQERTVRTGWTEYGKIPSVEVEEEVEGMEFAFTSDFLPKSKATEYYSPDTAMAETVVTTKRETTVKSGGPEHERASSEGHAGSKELASPVVPERAKASSEGHAESKELASPGEHEREITPSEGHEESSELSSPGGPERNTVVPSEGHGGRTESPSPVETQTAFVSTDQEQNSLKMTMVVDSGASSHYVDDKIIKGIKNHMFEYKILEKPSIITTAGMHRLRGSATGKLRVKVTDHNGEKKSVILPVTIVSGIGRNLFSSVTAHDKGFKTIISDNSRIENSIYKFPLRKNGQLFMIDMEIQEHPRTKSGDTALLTSQTNLWHQRLGHINEGSMKQLRDLPGTGVQFKDPLTPCDTCALGKSTQKKHPKTSNETTSTPFELVFTDLAGPFKTALDGSRYISKFTDHNTRFKAVYTIRSKDQAFETLNYFIQDYVIPRGHRIQRLRCDRGGEYTASYYQDFCKETGIVQEFAATNTPQQNGISERDGRTIMNMTRCLLVDTGLPKFLWAELCVTATYLINRAPHSALKGDSPYMRLFGKVPKLSALRVIGARAFVHIETHVHKLEKKAWEGVMIGYGKDSRAYRIYNPHNRRITESRNVTFIETSPRSLAKSKESLAKSRIDTSLIDQTGTEEDTAYEDDILDHLSVIHSSTNGDTSQSRSFLNKVDESRRNEASLESGGASSVSTPPSHVSFGQPSENEFFQEDNPELSQHSSEPPSPTPEQRQNVAIPRQTRSAGPAQPINEENIERGLRSFLPGPASDSEADYAHESVLPGYISYAYITQSNVQSNPDPASIPLPNTCAEALASPQAEMWKKAMDKEMNRLKENQVYDLIPKSSVPSTSKVIGTRWVFKVKSDFTFKARIVCQGWSQRPGIDCGSTFAPVCRVESIRIILAIGTQFDWDIAMLDVQSAFLQSPVDEPTFCRQAPGYEIPGPHPTNPLVMKLKQAVYGLRTASRTWYTTLDKALKHIGFEATRSDPCVYVYKKSNGFAYLTIYVDDILLTSPDKILIASLKERLMQRFSMTDLGEVSLILGMKVTRDRAKKTLRINQTDYTRSLLDKFNMSDCSPVSTPGVGVELPLEQPEETLLDSEGIKLYQSLVGSLLYLSRISRYDIAYSVLQLTRFTSKPSKIHLTRAKHCLRYLKGRPTLDIVYKRSNNFKLEGFADASFAAEPVKRRSTSGYIFMLANGPVSWVSSLQSIAAQSTVEAELMAITLAAKEAMHMRGLLHELGVNRFKVIQISNDNTGALASIGNPMVSSRTKHLELRKSFVSTLVEEGTIKLAYLSTERMIGDCLTKNLPKGTFNRIMDLIQSHGTDHEGSTKVFKDKKDKDKENKGA